MNRPRWHPISTQFEIGDSTRLMTSNAWRSYISFFTNSKRILLPRILFTSHLTNGSTFVSLMRALISAFTLLLTRRLKHSIIIDSDRGVFQEVGQLTSHSQKRACVNDLPVRPDIVEATPDDSAVLSLGWKAHECQSSCAKHRHLAENRYDLGIAEWDVDSFQN